MKLLPEENDLIGKWKLGGNTLERDSTARRIDRLIKEQLGQLGTDRTGWDVLYKDPGDGRLWELTYPESDSEGGGPPRLTQLDRDSARNKYGSIVDTQ